MHEENSVPRTEDEIGGSGQVASVESIAVAHRMDEAPHGQLGTGVLAPDPSHDPASFLGRERVHAAEPSGTEYRTSLEKSPELRVLLSMSAKLMA